jgi:hypothetical protein
VDNLAASPDDEGLVILLVVIQCVSITTTTTELVRLSNAIQLALLEVSEKGAELRSVKIGSPCSHMPKDLEVIRLIHPKSNPAGE